MQPMLLPTPRSWNLFTSHPTVVHHLRIFLTALINVEVPQIVDNGERGCVLRSQCILITSQCTVVHHLRVFETDLMSIVESKSVDVVGRGLMLDNQCLLFTSQCTVVH